MHDLTRLPETDPTEIYRYRDGLYAVDLLTAAITELDFFTWLDAHPRDRDGICAALRITERPTDVMLTLFTAEGFIRREADAFYVTALAREHFVRHSPFYIGPYFASLKERPVVRDFVTILRTGRPANWGSYNNEKPWSDAMLTDSFAQSFTAAMDCRGALLGAALATRLTLIGRHRLLDIAGGSGIYACAFTARHPHLRASVFERPPVDRIAANMISQRGFDGRVEVIAGDMFEDALPIGFDVHLFSNVLHDWDTNKVRDLLRASFIALEPRGLLVIHDAHVNAEKTGPLPVAKYSALLMSVTEGKCYSIAEMESLLTEVGFSEFHYEATIADRSFITAVKPR